MPESKVSEQKRNKILEDFLCFENSELFLKYKITDRELFNILAHGYIDNDEKIDISEFYRQQENKRNKEDKMNEIERLSYDNRNSAKINYETVTAAEFIIKKLQFDMFIFSKEGVSMDESLYLFKNTRSDFEVLLANRMDGSGEVIDLPEYKTYLFDERGGQIIARRLDWFLRDQADTLFKGHFKCEEIRKNFSNAFVIMIHFEVLLSKSFNPNILIDHIFESKGYILGYQNNPYGNDFVNEKINEIRIGKISDTKNITKVEMNKRYNFVTECISKEIISLPFKMGRKLVWYQDDIEKFVEVCSSNFDGI